MKVQYLERTSRLLLTPVSHRLLVLALAVLLVFLALPQPVHAAVIQVNTDLDPSPVGPGFCSLRDAIQSANTNTSVRDCNSGTSGEDFILVPPGLYTLNIAGEGEDANASGDLDITEKLTITGAGSQATIIAAGTHTVPSDVGPQVVPIDRVFHIHGVQATISGVTIRDGKVQSGNGFGGGIYNDQGVLILNSSIVRNNKSNFAGGGIFNDGTMTLTGTTVSNNDGGIGGGGGIYNGDPGGGGSISTLNSSTVSANSGSGIFSPGGTLTLNSSTVSGNSGSWGGGVRGWGTMRFTTSVITGNSATRGGGIHNDAGKAEVFLTDTTVSGNSATDFGGGIYNGNECFNVCTDSVVTLTRSTVSDNTAGIAGGGIRGAGGRLVSLNSTISNNSSPNGAGIGLTGAATATLNFTTVADNVPPPSGGLGGGIVTDSTASATIQNTIIARNSTVNCSGNVSAIGAGYNLTDGTCPLIGAIQTSTAGLKLGPLEPGVGPTETQALLPLSPAIDAADPFCPGLSLGFTDQRGVNRAQGPFCDIGAFEAPAPCMEPAGMNIGTGQNGANGPSSPDPIWTVDGHAAYGVTPVASPAWVTPTPPWNWIDPFGTGGLITDPPGTYVYETSFFVPDGVQSLSLSWSFAGDNDLSISLSDSTAAVIDGPFTFSDSQGALHFQNISIPISVYGTYTFSARVTNASGITMNPTGLLVQGTVTCVVPPVGGTVALSVSRSGSSVPWTPLAAVAAGVMAVLAVGGWYGRRRWLP